MNEKLKLFSYNGRLSAIKRSGQEVGRAQSETLISMRSRIEKNGSTTRGTVRISIHARLFKQTGWIVGDCVDVEIKDGVWCITRSTGGWKTGVGGSKEKKSKRVYFRISVAPDQLDMVGFGACREVEVIPGMIAFLPPIELVKIEYLKEAGNV